MNYNLDNYTQLAPSMTPKNFLPTLSADEIIATYRNLRAIAKRDFITGNLYYVAGRYKTVRGNLVGGIHTTYLTASDGTVICPVTLTSGETAYLKDGLFLVIYVSR